MRACKCEHWEVCPVCKPEWFDSEGNRLPPEPTPLQKAHSRIEELEQQLADRDEQISDLTISSDTYFAERNSARDVWRRASKDRDELRQQLAAKQAEVAELRQQVTLLRDEVTRCRDWFERQAKVTSKGGPSSWELMLLRDERDAADQALAATKEN